MQRQHLLQRAMIMMMLAPPTFPSPSVFAMLYVVLCTSCHLKQGSWHYFSRLSGGAIVSTQKLVLHLVPTSTRHIYSILFSKEHEAIIPSRKLGRLMYRPIIIRSFKKLVRRSKFQSWKSRKESTDGHEKSGLNRKGKLFHWHLLTLRYHQLEWFWIEPLWWNHNGRMQCSLYEENIHFFVWRIDQFFLFSYGKDDHFFLSSLNYLNHDLKITHSNRRTQLWRKRSSV